MRTGFSLKILLTIIGSMIFANCKVQCQTNQEQPSTIDVWKIPDNAAQELPPGVPRVVDTNGKVIYIPHKFTTELYQKEALDLLLKEANQVAMDLKLPEEMPITKSNLTEFHISPFGFSYGEKSIGFVATKNYTYYVARGNKFNQLTIANYDQACLKLKERGTLPVAQMDTNSAYQLATQWLAAASIDVAGLDRDYTAHIAVSPFWNGLAHLGETPKKKFVPIYYVWWNSSKTAADGHGDVADMELFSPSNTVLQMSVFDEKYILRKPVVFTNLASLFPGSVPVHTNHPAQTIYLSAPPP